MTYYDINGKYLNIRYYDKDGTYLDHGRMIYETVPQVGDIIHPFCGENGLYNWKVIEVKTPPNCLEIYIEDVPDPDLWAKTQADIADNRVKSGDDYINELRRSVD